MLRKCELFDRDWLFHLGDIPVSEPPGKSTSYIQAKTERRRTGPAARNDLDGTEFYGESGLISHDVWQKVDLPHDFIIGQAPQRENNECLGFFRYDTAWYRKHFILPELPQEARVRLYFEGVAVKATVWVNGCDMIVNRCGYSSFEIDITDFVDFGGNNVVAVKVETQDHEGWWYEGGGIYRHVWLEIADPVSVNRDGVFARPERQADGSWKLPVDVEIRNDGFAAETLRVKTTASSRDGILCEMVGETDVPSRHVGRITLTAENLLPKLWDVEDPNLYELTTEVYRGEALVDRTCVRFGFRTIRFDAEEGFFLNGRRVEIRGVCCHQDYGLTGKAVPEQVQRYRLQLMKQMGANGYRCAHYPHSAHTMDMLDELGFLVMAETRWFTSTPEGMAQLDMLVRRDRNHPGVILWSAGNEEPLHLTQRGYRIARSMLSRIRELDPTRPVTTAVSHNPVECPVLDMVDVIGVNYNLEQLDAIHAKYPHKPILSSECCATGTTRGWYHADAPDRGYVCGYDHDVNRSFVSRERTWKFFRARKWIAGGYQWAGIEHRGEAAWPRVCSQSGAVDLFLQKKDAFYQNQSFWLDRPMAHILPHWNWQGLEGTPIDVWVYTNCDETELFLNGKSMGRQKVEPCGHGAWKVGYVPGKLEAVCYRNGKIATRDCVETSDRAERLKIEVIDEGKNPDGSFTAMLTVSCLDAAGRFVPDASPSVRLICEGGSIVGTGSDVSDHVPVTSPDRRMRAGLLSVLVRARNPQGELCILASAEGLPMAGIAVETQ